jgi:inosine/xanthosine triphosphatase
MDGMKVIVASLNPAKLEAAKLGFASAFPGVAFEFESIAADSGVSEQPMGDDETIRGALNRAAQAKAAKPEADFWIGMEGGVEETPRGLAERAWMAVIDKNGVEGVGSSGTFYLPRAIADVMRTGKNLGDACDDVFSGTDSRRDNGAVGLLTKDAVRRAELYRHGIVFALIPFQHPDLFPA